MPRKVSLKEIVSAIDKVLDEFDEESRNRGKESIDERSIRAKQILKGIRESVVGVCVPDFEVPAA